MIPDQPWSMSNPRFGPATFGRTLRLAYASYQGRDAVFTVNRMEASENVLLDRASHRL
jgi:hypothetical protein